MRFTDRLEVPNPTNPIPTSDLIQMGRIHDVIGRIKTMYILEAWRGIERARPGDRTLQVSETESLRFYRAFYRLDLFFKLCRGDGAPGPLFLRSRSCFFLLLHPPWELGQMACAYRHLERCFVMRAGVKGLQPHEIGLSNEDHLARSRMRSRWLDIWISQGLEFWLLVEQADSRETVLALLASVVKRKFVFFKEMYLKTFPASRLFSPWCRLVQGNM
ncbi:hypothetical protein F4782DRAFT_502084 [Xylaria castorea]|nr:hypothetical protein F4782DRAFT_502084 [Xylaria castorea]